MKKLLSLKIKTILPIFFILILVFFASSLVIIDREYNAARDSLISGAESYSSLSVVTLINNYNRYYESGFYQFIQIVDDLMMLDENVYHLQVVDINGKILFNTTELLQKTKYDEATLGERYIEEDNLIERYSSSTASKRIFENEQYMEIIQPYIDEWGRHDYSVRYLFTLSSLDIMRQEMINTVFIYSGVFIVISFLLIFLLFNRFITTPIGRLIKGVRLMSKGKLGAKVEVKSKDELGELASAFNKMSKELKKSQDSLKEYSQDLEKLVTKRTEELEDKTVYLERINKDLIKTRKELNVLNKNLEKRIKERTEEIEQLLKQKDEFINQLSHDLKSPLNPMTILLPILEKQETDPKKIECFQVLKRNVEYMKNIATKTLELAKLNSPKTKFSLDKVDLKDEIKRIIQNKKTFFENKNLKIQNKITQKLLINADKLRFEELISNLLENSVKYSYDNGKIIFDAVVENDYLKISISDTGAGMTKKQIKHVFDEFYKADKARHDFESSGLGLTICKKIVEKHGGKIWVESPGLGKGTTVFFTLPIYTKKQ
ncbi:MAG: HAMP domain-containing protein [Thermoplasmatales archaeon]|nr:MAG: HAMP domain-containing protein [Thermoplasmatales archaeon]